MGKLKATLSKVPWRGLGEALGLLIALTFVFSMQFIPHLDTFSDPEPEEQPALVSLGNATWNWAQGEREGYPYTIHADENVHWAEAAGVQRHDQVMVGYPTGASEEQGLLSLRGSVHEAGFKLILAQGQELTGVSWKSFFQYGPALWMVFTAFAMYALLRPHPAAIPAALLVGLIPTTPRFLGTGILVPIGFVLAWLPAVAILSEAGARNVRSLALLLMVAAWAFFVHLIGGFAVVGLLLSLALFAAREDRRSAFTLLGLALVPLLWLWRTFAADIQREAGVEEFLPVDWTIFDNWGVPTLGLWAMGLALLVLWPPREKQRTFNAFGLFSLAALALIVCGVVFGLDRYATYARWHPPFFLAAAIPAAHAVTTLGRAIHEGLAGLADRVDWKAVRAVALAGPVLSIAVSGVALAGAVSEPVGFHMDEGFYHVLNDAQWSRFQSATDQVGPQHQVGLAEPWSAPVLAALTGVHQHAWLGPGSPPVNGPDYDRFRSNGGDLEFFIMNDITVIVDPRQPAPEEFHRTGNDVWLMDDEIAQELAKIRAREGR